MIREISRSPKVFRISDTIRPATPMAHVSARQEIPAVQTPAFHQRLTSSANIDAHQIFARLEDHFIAKYGHSLATVKAQMLFDACGPGRDIDPQSLFVDDSDGDSWAESIIA